MGRPIYSHEMGDPDFFWLISSFRESHPQYSLLESGGLPLVLIYEEKQDTCPDVPVVSEPQPAEERLPQFKKP